MPSSSGIRVQRASRRLGVALVALVAIVATPVLIASQQQTSNARAGWPCRARIDPSYFRVAEGSGGHLLLLAPEEISDAATLLTAFSAHSQTIFRLAGSIPRELQDFQVPIDPSIESVVFSISVQCLQAAYVVRPTGEIASGDDVTELSSFRAERMWIVKRPQPGIWTLRVAGSGVAGVVAQARSAIGIAQLEFAPAQAAAFTLLPSFGVENALRIRMSGSVAGIQGTLVSGGFGTLASLQLSPGDAEGTYVSRFMPSAAGFRVLIAGKDQQGFAFQRMHAPLFTPLR